MAQGIEAGGHRGHFDADDDSDEQQTTSELVTRLAALTSLPIVAAGGLMDGKDIRNLLNQGASAAQMGTAFLCCDEAGTSPTHKHFIMNEKEQWNKYLEWSYDSIRKNLGYTHEILLADDFSDDGTW